MRRVFQVVAACIVLNSTPAYADLNKDADDGRASPNQESAPRGRILADFSDLEAEFLPESGAEANLWDDQPDYFEDLAIVPGETDFLRGQEAFVEGEYDEAYAQFRAAAEQGHSGAQHNLGLMYRKGEGIPKNDVEAAKWFRAAAEQGVAQAQLNLGIMYANGEGVPNNDTEAERWLRAAVEQEGTEITRFDLGLMYRFGELVPKNDAEAAKWFRAAAEQGHSGAQYYLGWMYDNGEGILQDHAEAVRWYQVAAEQGEARAQFNLGVSFAKGEGIPKNDTQAAKWFQAAAEQGDAKAQYLLGLNYAIGVGVPKNYVLAYHWVNLAAAQGLEKAAESRDSFEEDMTPEQIAEAQRLAAAFQPRASSAASSIPELPPAIGEALASTGTGFFVTNNGYFLTNHHVVEDCTEIKIALPSGSVDATLIGAHLDDDLVVLRVDARPDGIATFRRGTPELGEDVLVVGYPLRGVLDGINVTTGSVSATSGPQGDRRLLQITAPVQQGNSGGPLLDGSGAVVGVVVAKLNALAVARETGDIPQNVNFAIKGAVARSFLSIHDIPYSEVDEGQDTGRVGVAAQAKKHTSLVECWK